MHSLKQYGRWGLVVLFFLVGLAVGPAASAAEDGDREADRGLRTAFAPSQFPQGPSLRETGRVGSMTPQGSGELPRRELGKELGMPSETTVQQVAFVDRNPAAANGAGTIDPDVLEREVQARLAAAQACRIEVARRKQVTPAEVQTGPLALRWTILPSGTVASSAVIATTADDADLADCVKKQMVSWIFTGPRGGSVQVERTFQLGPAQAR